VLVTRLHDISSIRRDQNKKSISNLLNNYDIRFGFYHFCKDIPRQAITVRYGLYGFVAICIQMKFDD